MISCMCDNKKATVKDLQVLAGTLNFLNKAIVPGRVFTRHMYAKYAQKINENRTSRRVMSEPDDTETNKFRTQLKQHHHVSLDREFRNDCEVWKLFLLHQSAVCRPFLDLDHEVLVTTLGFFTDASRGKNLGFGCYYNLEWVFGQWEPNFIDTCKPSIAYLELFALCVGIFTWEKKLTNIRIRIFCDNQSVIQMVNNNTPKCPNYKYLLRMLTCLQ